jgi:RNA ligase
MNYQFPEIKHLDDVRPAIAGRDEFIIAERDWGYVVNYLVVMSDTFPEVKTAGGSAAMREEANLHKAIRRECRGLLFYPDGRIMARRLHKFFNINERDETQFSEIDFTQPHVILEKLDGSMITPVVVGNDIRWGTKMGITEVSMGPEEFVARNPDYQEFAEFAIGAGKTPIFEWCSRKQRIVVDYPEDRLVLIAIRDNVTGEYVSYEGLKNLVGPFKIDLVKTYEGSAKSMTHLMDETKTAEGLEGYIIRFDNGHMLKVKGEWYLRIHKSKDNLTFEKNVVDMLVNEKMDDAKSFMMNEDRERVEQFETEFWQGVADSVKRYESYFQTVLKSGLDRKRYALEWMPTIKSNDPFAPSYVFARFNGKDPRELIVEEIRKNTGTQTKIDSVRHLWGDAHWDYNFQGDN